MALDLDRGDPGRVDSSTSALIKIADRDQPTVEILGKRSRIILDPSFHHRKRSHISFSLSEISSKKKLSACLRLFA